MIFTLLQVSAAHENKGSHLYECIFKHAKDNGLLGHEKHLNYTPGPTNVSFCDQAISEFREKTFVSLRDLVEEDKSFTIHSDCIVNMLKDFKIDENYIEKFVYDEDKSMSRLRRQKALSEVLSYIEDRIELAEELCAPDIMFGEWFDEYVDVEIDHSLESDETSNSTESHEDDDEELHKDYCQKIHLIDAGFINTKFFNVKVNPKNIDISHLDCDKIWLETSEEFIIDLKDEFASRLDSSSRKAKECMIHTIKQGNYAEMMVKVFILSEAKLTDEQRIDERNKYISFMSALFADIMRCNDKN